MPQGLSDRVRQRRLALGLSQQQLAELVPCHQSQISRLEAGRRLPDDDTLARIAEELGYDSIEQLLRGDEPRAAAVAAQLPRYPGPAMITVGAMRFLRLTDAATGQTLLVSAGHVMLVEPNRDPNTSGRARIITVQGTSHLVSDDVDAIADLLSGPAKPRRGRIAR